MTVLTVGLGLAAYLSRRRRRPVQDDESGLTREQVIAARSRASMGDFMEHGPRLWAGRQSYVLARSSDGRRVLLGGVGGMGIGRMWTPIAEGDASRYERDQTYIDAPVDDEALDDFGENGRGAREWAPARRDTARPDLGGPTRNGGPQ